MLRLDLHTHSKYSPDSSLEVKEIVKTATKRGIHGVCVADHNTLRGSSLAETLEVRGVIVVRGVELSSKEGHILAYGLREDVAPGLSAEEVVQQVVDQGGFPVAAHPYRFWSGLGEEVIRAVPFQGLEALNSRSVARHNARAGRLAEELRLPVTAGSDAHRLTDIGRTVVLLPDGLETGEEVMESLRKGEGRTAGASRGAGRTVHYVGKAVSGWILRGFRRI